ncbi:Non-ribosomal peptide synthetase [Minicystis rosea]|nr:Non-ribosomal peptide synthetase [Minicystis rosea]
MLPPHFVAPRDVCELRLTRIWETVLGRDDIGVKDDFFARGGDHAKAQAAVTAITAQLDMPLSLEAFVEAPTVEHLACRLRARSRRLNQEPVVALQPHGSKRPFFFLPGGEGNVLNFHDLARRMEPDQPLYGLQNPGLHGDRPLHRRMEDMAAEHIAAMRTVQPRGPYLLGGHCAGAMVALEMALQLQRRDEEVAVLAVCDAWSPAVTQERMKTETFLDDLVVFYTILAAGFRCWFGTDLGLNSETIRAIAPEQRAACLMRLAREHGVYPPDTPDDRLDRTLGMYRFFSDCRYVPAERFRGPITYLRARDSDFCETPTEGWEDVTTTPLRFREVPGNHVTHLVAPNVESVAHEIQAAIAEAQVS